jgi:chemotaxis protein methyltransferase CheR
MDGEPKDLEKLEIELLLQGLYAWYGYDYRDYAYHSIRRRILYRMQAEGIPTVTGLLDKLLRDPECLRRLVADFSIHVTEMFRDPTFFYTFREQVVPILRTYPSLRIWHAGCSTGEEVYSMAILLEEEGLYDKATIYATDMSAKALKTAKAGVFPLADMKKFTGNYMRAGGKGAFSDYYNVLDGGVRFHSRLTKNVVFAQHNLVTDGSFNEFNVIFCRNVLIYFNKALQEKVHALFYESLGLFGILGLGDKETIAYTRHADGYEEVLRGEKLYRKVK